MTDIVRKSDYIFAQGANRELTTIIRLICDSGGQASHQFGAELNWSMPYVWLGLRIPQERLLSRCGAESNKFMGDVDVCGGSLQPTSPHEYNQCFESVKDEFRRLAVSRSADRPSERSDDPPPLAIHNLASVMLLEKRMIKWPPDLSQISAVEVKAAWYSAENDLKATGRKKEGRNQAQVLCKMGFDRVALAKYVITEPVTTSSAHPWFIASARSADAGHEYLNSETKGIMVHESDPFGTLLVEQGSIPGKLEHMAGSVGWKWLRSVPPNPYVEKAVERHKSIEETLREVMGRYPIPSRVPVLVLACSNERCGNLYCSESDPSQPCSECGSLPRSAPH